MQYSYPLILYFLLVAPSAAQLFPFSDHVLYIEVDIELAVSFPKIGLEAAKN